MAARSIVDTLQEIAQKEVDAAADRLAAANRQLQGAQQQLQQLQTYRKEYLEKLSRQLAAGLDAEAHRNFQRFMRMLDGAIAGQEHAVQLAEQAVAQQRGLWQQGQKKKLSYEVLSDRAEQKATQAERKKEQKLMDEHAMRARKYS